MADITGRADANRYLSLLSRSRSVDIYMLANILLVICRRNGGIHPRSPNVRDREHPHCGLEGI